MRRIFSLVGLLAATALLAGCFEQIYVSSAPDGTIAVCGGGDLYMVNADMTEATFVAEKVVRAEFSPDGNRLLCALDRGEGDGRYFEIAICDRKGRVLSSVDRKEIGDSGRELREVELEMICPRWSPDGKFISYLMPDRQHKGFLELRVREIDGPYTDLVSCVSAGYAWSRDSRRIAVIATATADPSYAGLASVQVWTMKAGEGETRLIEPAGVVFNPYLWIGWLPDSQGVIFTANRMQLPVAGKQGLDTIPLQVFSVDLEGRDLKGLLPDSVLSTGAAGMFDVSPDGRKLAYLVWDPRKPDDHSILISFRGTVFVSNTDGSSPRDIFSQDVMYGCPRWLSNDRVACIGQPDGGDEEQRGVYVVDVNSGKTVCLGPLISKVARAREKAKDSQTSATLSTESTLVKP